MLSKTEGRSPPGNLKAMEQSLKSLKQLALVVEIQGCHFCNSQL